MGLFKKSIEKRDLDNFLSTLLELAGEQTTITREVALEIPAVESSVRIISGLISSMDVLLCKIDESGKVEIIEDDYRIRLLNDNTGDTLSSVDLKASLVSDLILDGNSYVYLEKKGNEIKSLRYVETQHVNKICSSDVIFKDAKIQVDTKEYNPWDFIICCKNTTDGVSGQGLLERNSKELEIAYESMLLNLKNIKSQGIQRGIIYAERQLTKEALETLK